MSNFGNRWFRVSLVASAFLALAACGGGGGGGGPSGPGPSKVFAADQLNSSVGSSPSANPSPGSSFVVDRIIFGPSTQLSGGLIPSIALDSPRDMLYVSANQRVLVYNGAGTATGNVAPARTIQASTTVVTPPTVFGHKHVQLNPASDVLYISTVVEHILAVHGASAASGIVTATRTFTVSPLPAANSVVGLALDTVHDRLYIAVNRSAAIKVAVISGVSAAPTGTTSGVEFDVGVMNTASIAVDAARDRLYVANSAGQILVFDSASTLTTVATVSRTIQLPFSNQHQIFLESSNDRLYAVAQNHVVILNNAGTAVGAVAATALLLSSPSDLSAVVARP